MLGEDDPGADIEALILLAVVHGDEAAMRAASALRAWLDGALLFEECLGKAPGWRNARRQKQRNSLLFELADRHFRALSGRRLARAVYERWLEYEKRWPEDRVSGKRPGGPEAFVFDILKLGDGFPSYGRLREILG
jgi:hypothetical protein